MFKLLLLALALAAPAAVRAEGLGSALGQSVSSTVQVGPLAMHPNDVQATVKKDYVYVMADLFPYREALKTAGKAGEGSLLAKALVKNLFAAKYPDAPYFKVVLAEFPERDEYDAPRWDKIQVLGRYKVARKGTGWSAAKIQE